MKTVLALKINNYFVDLDDNTVTFVNENPMFAEDSQKGEFTYQIKLPMTDKNRMALGFAGEEGSQYNYLGPVDIYFYDQFYARGSVTLLEVSDVFEIFVKTTFADLNYKNAAIPSMLFAYNFPIPLSINGNNVFAPVNRSNNTFKIRLAGTGIPLGDTTLSSDATAYGDWYHYEDAVADMATQINSGYGAYFTASAIGELLIVVPAGTDPVALISIGNTKRATGAELVNAHMLNFDPDTDNFAFFPVYNKKFADEREFFSPVMNLYEYVGGSKMKIRGHYPELFSKNTEEQSVTIDTFTSYYQLYNASGLAGARVMEGHQSAEVEVKTGCVQYNGRYYRTGDKFIWTFGTSIYGVVDPDETKAERKPIGGDELIMISGKDKFVTVVSGSIENVGNGTHTVGTTFYSASEFDDFRTSDTNPGEILIFDAPTVDVNPLLDHYTIAPAVRMKAVVEKIITDSGYTPEGTFFTNDFIHKLFLYSKKRFKNYDQATITVNGAGQTVTYNTLDKNGNFYIDFPQKCSDLINGLRKLFGLHIQVDNILKTFTIDYIKDNYAGAHEDLTGFSVPGRRETPFEFDGVILNMDNKDLGDDLQGDYLDFFSTSDSSTTQFSDLPNSDNADGDLFYVADHHCLYRYNGNKLAYSGQRYNFEPYKYNVKNYVWGNNHKTVNIAIGTLPSVQMEMPDYLYQWLLPIADTDNVETSLTLVPYHHWAENNAGHEYPLAGASNVNFVGMDVDSETLHLKKVYDIYLKYYYQTIIVALKTVEQKFLLPLNKLMNFNFKTIKKVGTILYWVKRIETTFKGDSLPEVEITMKGGLNV